MNGKFIISPYCIDGGSSSLQVWDLEKMMNLNEKGRVTTYTSTFLVRSIELETLKMTTCTKLVVDNNSVVLIGERPFSPEGVRIFIN